MHCIPAIFVWLTDWICACFVTFGEWLLFFPHLCRPSSCQTTRNESASQAKIGRQPDFDSGWVAASRTIPCLRRTLNAALISPCVKSSVVVAQHRSLVCSDGLCDGTWLWMAASCVLGSAASLAWYVGLSLLHCADLDQISYEFRMPSICM